MTRNWWTATDDEWAAEVERRWLEIAADNGLDPESDDDCREIDSMMLEDLRWCE
ncbi:hypothetical protein [Hansschlegelia sp. KR7-227]|uniref:hypothetical protein n=1 Tax=Hansschlegelia sp. KR7-227 TaxID=3400914 RepID=UPI003C080B68